MQSLIRNPVRAAETEPAPAFLSVGFRPFFWLAALYAALSLPLWLAALVGHFSLEPRFPAPYWHAHEMVFGFTLAVVAGFLLTAVSKWTGRETARGGHLAALALLWIAGRLVVLGGNALPPVLVWAVDLAFLPALALTVARPIVATRNHRNYVFLVLLGLMFVGNALMHAGQLQRGARLGVGIVVVMIVAITGRVVPMFTRNATRVESIRSLPWLDRIALGTTLAVALGDLFGLDLRVVNGIALVAGASVILRTWHWGTLHTLRQPLLWVLHAAVWFVGVGLALRFFADAYPSMSVHALTVGGIGLSTIGMMARVALGHTGRMLVAPRSVTVGFVLCVVAAAVRTVVPLLGPSAYLPGMLLAGTAFALAFALYLVAYTKILFGRNPAGA
jgi:uncharacterized protein involved in response to NO